MCCFVIIIHVLISINWFCCKFSWILHVLLLVELFGALRGRLYDSNKNIIMATLTTIGNVASAMGQAVEKSSKVGGFCLLFSTFVLKHQIAVFNQIFCEMICCRVFCQMF